MTEETEKHLYTEVKNLPDFSDLNTKVKAIVKSSSWFELFGYDWLQFGLAILCLPLGLFVMRHEDLNTQFFGLILLTCYHTCLTTRAGHLASHGALAHSPSWNYAWHMLFSDFLGAFSNKCGHDIHIKYHHPHTNIIGLGDSSTWKAPFLSTYVYMFLGPFSLPVLAPIVSVRLLIEGSDWKHLAIFVVVALSGIAFHLYLLMCISNLSFLGAVCVLYLLRAGLSIPYIHINIFQHIGLPMYSPKDRPARIYQMASGCLNLGRNLLLDFIFGHSLVNCHIEHHMFPRLSDNMCLKVKPVVRSFLTENGLPYREESYASRLTTFLKEYETLMVHAPPITHLVGLQ